MNNKRDNPRNEENIDLLDEVHIEKASPAAAFLRKLERNGWLDSYASELESIKSSLHGSEIASALIEYWQDDPSLDNFANQLNGAISILSDAKQQKLFIKSMNLAYFQNYNVSRENIETAYNELLFWDACDMPEAKAHFELVGQHFAKLLAADAAVGPELTELLQTRNLSPQMKEVRRMSIDMLRENFRGQLTMQRSPIDRLSTVLEIATGTGGARIVNESIWEIARQSIDQGSKSNADVYIKMRNLLNDAADGQMLDHPRETLSKINQLIERLDTKAHYGVHYDSGKILQYWRGQHFNEIPDAELVTLYTNYFKTHPSAPSLIQQDKAMLAGRSDPELMSLLSGKSDFSNGDSERRRDGFSDRTAKNEAKFDKRIIGYAILGILVVALVILLATLIPKDGDDKNIKPDISPSATIDADEEEQRSREDDRQDEKPETKAPTQAPTQAPTKEASPIPTPAPTPDPTPEPTSTPVPEPSSDPTQEPAPTNNSDPEINEEDETLDENPVVFPDENILDIDDE